MAYTELLIDCVDGCTNGCQVPSSMYAVPNKQINNTRHSDNRNDVDCMN